MRLERLLPAAALVLVAAGAVLAFIVIGSPHHARQLTLDKLREADLTAIAPDVHARYAHAALPGTLSGSLARRDPATHEAYDYQRTDKQSYVLCATFDANRSDEKAETPPDTVFAHGRGHTCFAIDAAQTPPEPRRIR